MIYFVDPKKKKRNTAGAKAPEDITELCRRRGYTGFEFAQYPKGKGKIYQRIWLQTIGNREWYKVYRKVSRGDAIIYQHPSYGKRTAIKWIKRISGKGCKTIVLIHDLESLRGGIAGLIKTNKATEIGDNELLKCFDKVICHNKHMLEYLVNQGFDRKRITTLEIFDYLSECQPLVPSKEGPPSIAIAGNLAYGKSAYIYKIHENGNNSNMIVHLFGNRFDEEQACENMIYHGSFKPEKLPGELKGCFGLVWDGTEAYTCSGNTGNYLKYNNPHKTSLYLSSGMPVIVWSQAAIADFISEHSVGITVDSLYELEEKISSVSKDEYTLMQKNTEEISEKLHSGYFFYKALDECLGSKE